MRTMRSLISIGVILVLRPCGFCRIDDARVMFVTMNEEQIAEWNGIFENITVGLKETEACKNIVADEQIDLAPCVDMFLTTRSKPSGTKLTLGDHLALREGGFQKSNRLIMIVHGFFQSTKKNWIEKTQNALLQYGDFNVVIVQWNALSVNVYYPRVVQHALKVAEYLAQFIDFFVDAGVSLENIHLIGHSLGAHIAGVASHKATRGIVGRITGLDAARPLFFSFDDDLKLDKSDADFVDCIHTSGIFVGIHNPFCHADFYPNGGRVQPGCPEYLSLGRCGHLRATKYFLESISDNVTYKAFKCATMSNFDPVTCWDEGAVMGFLAEKSHQGIFYVETGVHPPYHTASSQQELEQANADSLNPFLWMMGRITEV